MRLTHHYTCALTSLVALGATACDQLESSTPASGAAPAVVAAALDDRTEPEKGEDDSPDPADPTDPADPKFEGTGPSMGDDPFPIIPLHLDFCEPAVRRELRSFTDGVRATYEAADTTGWQVAAVREQDDGTRCVVRDVGGYARSVADFYLAYGHETRQPIASVSKTFGAIALIEAMRNHPDQVHTSDVIASYLPADWKLGPGTETITFFELLTHNTGLAGIPAKLSSIKWWFENADCDSTPNVLCFTRGGMTDYSNAGFVLVQYLFARLAYPDSFSDQVTSFSGPLNDQYLSGLLLEAHLQVNHLTPLGLTASCTGSPLDASAYPVGSGANLQAVGKAASADSRSRCATGGMRTTATDVAVFLSAFHNGELDLGLASGWVDLIEDYRFGFDVLESTPDGDKYLMKRGLAPMVDSPKAEFKSLAAIFPESNTTVTILVNEPANLRDTFRNAWDNRVH